MQRQAKTLFKHEPKDAPIVATVKSDAKGYFQAEMEVKVSYMHK